MRCIKCHSPRTIKFLDGFEKDRIFCKDCQESILINDAIIAQSNVWEFSSPTINQRWKYNGNRKIGSFPNPR